MYFLPCRTARSAGAPALRTAAFLQTDLLSHGRERSVAQGCDFTRQSFILAVAQKVQIPLRDESLFIVNLKSYF